MMIRKVGGGVLSGRGGSFARPRIDPDYAHLGTHPFTLSYSLSGFND
jgi:hypothetical protein